MINVINMFINIKTKGEDCILMLVKKDHFNWNFFFLTLNKQDHYKTNNILHEIMYNF